MQKTTILSGGPPEGKALQNIKSNGLFAKCMFPDSAVL